MSLYKVKNEEFEMFRNGVGIDFYMKENQDLINILNYINSDDVSVLMPIVNFKELQERLERFSSSMFFYVKEIYDFGDDGLNFEEFAETFSIKYEIVEEEEDNDDFRFYNSLEDFVIDVVDDLPELYEIESYGFYCDLIKDAFGLEEFTIYDVVYKK